MKVQVTLFDKSGKYRPISTLIKIKNIEEFENERERIKADGIKKILIKRGWGRRELMKYNYLTCKMRIYPDPGEE